MSIINENFAKLPGGYLFAEIARRASAYETANPDKTLIKLGIGDVTLPLAPAVVEAMKKAADEMSDAATFRGYGPYEGYAFLREAIADNDYKPYGAKINADEIFISDGAKSDCGNICDIFSNDSIVAVCDPVYPVYVDANAMSGRAGDWDGEKWTRIVYMPCTAENGFVPELPTTVPELIYLCYPNNPTGEVATKAQLKLWVDYANKNGSVILFDAAYRAYISDPSLPRSIYEIPGAETCAIEFVSYSKTAGFTGTRCGWTVIPRALKRDGVSLYDLWMRRQASKFNGTSYVIQRAAEAIYSPAGRRQIQDTIAYYMRNAKVMRDGLSGAGLELYGGVDSPYVWLRTPVGVDSWDFFDRLLREANVITTPGAGFGPSGEGYIRLTAFGDAEKTKQAVERIVHIL
ncbi:MAG: LL-diaminopimelate aminotransferase [Oscillospiraceae bacterium]